MSHQSNVLQAYVTRYDPEPIKENATKETKETEEPTSASIDEKDEGSSES